MPSVRHVYPTGKLPKVKQHSSLGTRMGRISWQISVICVFSSFFHILGVCFLVFMPRDRELKLLKCMAWLTRLKIEYELVIYLYNHSTAIGVRNKVPRNPHPQHTHRLNSLNVKILYLPRIELNVFQGE